jgi:hypothetical protein
MKDLKVLLTICYPFLTNCSPSLSFLPLVHTLIINEYITETMRQCFHFHMYKVLYLWTCYQSIDRAVYCITWFCVYYMFCRVTFISARAVFIYAFFTLQLLKHLWGYITTCCTLCINEIILQTLNLNHKIKKICRHKLGQCIKVQKFLQQF